MIKYFYTLDICMSIRSTCSTLNAECAICNDISHVSCIWFGDFVVQFNVIRAMNRRVFTAFTELRGNTVVVFKVRIFLTFVTYLQISSDKKNVCDFYWWKKWKINYHKRFWVICYNFPFLCLSVFLSFI